jgi:hypothetical protein
VATAEEVPRTKVRRLIDFMVRADPDAIPCGDDPIVARIVGGE